MDAHNPSDLITRYELLHFLAYGILYLCFRWSMNILNFVENAELATGTVIGFSSGRANHSTVHYPEISFTTHRGEVKQFTHCVGSNPPSFKVNEEVGVFYLDRDPDKVKLNGFISLFIGPIIISIFAIAALIVAHSG